MSYPIRRLIPSLDVQRPIDYWVGVPDTRLAHFIDAVRHVTPLAIAPREDLAVAAAFGASLADRRAGVYMKDAGLGHCLDAVLTTFKLAGLPLTMLISTIGELETAPPHHKMWGSVTAGLLSAIGVPSLALSVAAPDEVTNFVAKALREMTVHAILVDVILI